MSLGILILLVVLVPCACILALLATGMLRVRVETHAHCGICGREITSGGYQRSVLWERLRGEPGEIGLLYCENCAAGYPVIARPASPGS